MKAILKDIEIPESKGHLLVHPVKMIFIGAPDSPELYHFGTTIESQFCTKEEYDAKEGLPNKLLEEKIRYSKSLIGKLFEINLYKFTVKEMTANKYVAFKFINDYYFDNDSITIREYHLASYMTKEDVILNMKYTITMQGIKRSVKGVLPDDSEEKITTNLFFPKPIPEKKKIEIPCGKYPNLTASYIVNEVAIKDIQKGCNLAYQIREWDIPHYDFDIYIHQIEDYRSRVRAAKAINESLRKKIFFWEPKEVVEELRLSSNVISLFKECIILGRLYPSDCEKADKDYVVECDKRLRQKYMHENVDETDFKDKYLKFRKNIGQKYRGKSVVKVIN